MRKKISVISGDGIGVEIVKQAINVLNTVAKSYNHSFEYIELLGGGIAIDKTGCPLPQDTIKTCLSSDAVLLGAMGGPKWDNLPCNQRPEAGLLELRKTLGVFANLRPAVLHKSLKNACPLREDLVKDGLDIMVIRELTGGLYFGKKGREETKDMGQAAFDVMYYTEYEIERIARVGFETARKRNKKLTSVDKANVIETSRLWREVVIRVSKDYPDVELNHLYVDNAAMQLVINPSQFDVIVTENMFGDILSDEASMITGSIGMLPSASLGDTKLGLFEPIHGSAPDIAGLDKANPIATIESVAMMLRYSLDMPKEADVISTAIKNVLEKGYRTSDIMSEGMTLVGCKKMGELICTEVQ